MRCTLSFVYALFLLAALNVRAAAVEAKLPDNVQAVLDKAKEVEVYVLGAPSKEKEILHGWKVIEKTTITAKDTVELLLESIVRDLSKPGREADCFSPGAAIRVIRDKDHVELLLCYKCNRLEAYFNDKPVADTPLCGHDGNMILGKVILEARELKKKGQK